MTRVRLRTYWLIWYTTAANALQQAFVSPWTNALFFLGKAIRFSMMLAFLFVLRRANAGMAGYTADQVVVFFLTYQLVDISTQILYRGVYMFSPLIRDGRFDGFLSKPMSPLFRALTGHPDINDTLFLLPVLVSTAWIFSTLELALTGVGIAWYLLLLANGFLIATGLHILILAAGILLTDVDGVIWLYRDLMRFGQFPAVVYAEPLRSVLYFVVPVGLMVTIPAEVLLGELTMPKIVGTLLAGVGFLGVSLIAWKYALRQYSSAGG